jgi:uncharacterized iron-regulated protein
MLQGMINSRELHPGLAAVVTMAVVALSGPGIRSAVAQDSSPDVPSAADTAYAPGEFRIFTGAGEPATLDDIVDAMTNVSVVFVGETHDDPTQHMLEFELLQRAHASHGGAPVALSLEFFQSDVQPIVDEYLMDLISERSFLADSRPWPRYQTDYRPLVEFAKENGIAVIAANAPRRYASRVTRHGRESLDDLPPLARESLPPLPYGEPSESYRKQWIGVISEVMEQEGKKCGIPIEQLAAEGEDVEARAPVGAHGNMGNQIDSQVLWDASMAWAIAQHLERVPDALVMHMVGGFHVERGTGTPEHLDSYRPGTVTLIVAMQPVEDVELFEPAPEGEWGDFVIQTDVSRTLEEIECRRFLAERAERRGAD